MKARGGQVVVYLAFVMLAIATLMLLNFFLFVDLRDKNRRMNAVDEAAIAAAKVQGSLLNEIGRANRRHLIAVIRNDGTWTEADNENLYELVRNRPGVEAASAAVAAAHAWGMKDCSVEADYKEIEGAFAIAPFTSGGFYDAMRAKSWCWFSLYGRTRYLDLDLNSLEVEIPPYANAGNSETYSLHVTFHGWEESGWWGDGAPTPEWTNFICKVTGCSEAEVAAAPQLTDGSQVWAFYDSSWSTPWSDTFSPEQDFPIAGHVREEYDVVGCSARCRLETAHHCATAEAKPFGTVLSIEGEEISKVTEYCNFIIPSRPDEDRIFTEAQLVVYHSVPHPNAVDTEPEWYAHVRDHLAALAQGGVEALNGSCAYCKILKEFADPATRSEIKTWLMNNQCAPAGEGTVQKGGYPCAH